MTASPRPAVTVATALHRSAPFVDVVSANIERIVDNDVEILLSDCTALDDALDQLRDRHGDDPRVVFLRSDDRFGWVDHYNALLRRARGRYFMWMAHDDDFSPGYVPRLRAALDARPDTLLAFGSLRAVEADGAPLDVPYLPDLPVELGELPHAQEAIVLLDRWNLGIPTRGLFRREEILRRRLTIRHTRRDVDADAYWALGVVASGPIVFVPECSVAKRVVPGSGSARWPVDRRSVLGQLEVTWVVARHLAAARVPPRDAWILLRFVAVRSVQRALLVLPVAVRSFVPAGVRRRVGSGLAAALHRAGAPSHAT